MDATPMQLSQQVTSNILSVFHERYPLLSQFLPVKYVATDATLGDKLRYKRQWREVRGLKMEPESGVSLLLEGAGWVKFKEDKEVEIQEAA